MKKIANALALIACLTLGACAADDGGPSGNGGSGGSGGTAGTGGSTTDGGTSDEKIVAKVGGVDKLLVNGRYCANATATLVGDCMVEGLSWTQGVSITKASSGWYEVALNGSIAECYVSLKDCGNPLWTYSTGATCGGTWANYGCPAESSTNIPGSPAAPGTHEGGPFMYCGNYLGGDYTCNIAFVRSAGGDPQPRGIVPNGP